MNASTSSVHLPTFKLFGATSAGPSVCPGERWGVTADSVGWPSPVGLTLGILAALCGQLLAIAYHYWHVHYCKSAVRVQKAERPYEFFEGVATHLSRPGGIVTIAAYLSLTCAPPPPPAVGVPRLA